MQLKLLQSLKMEDNSEVIVVNDILGYMQCMIDSLPKDQLVEHVYSHYKQQDVVAAREVLYNGAPSEFPVRLVRHKEKRDVIGALYDVMQLMGVHAPLVLYTCRNVRNIPPTTMKNVDPVMLL